MSWWKRLILVFAPVLVERFLTPAEVEEEVEVEVEVEAETVGHTDAAHGNGGSVS